MIWSRVTSPQLYGFVVLERGRGDNVLSGVAGRTENDVRVPLQLLHDLLRLQVPNVDLVIFRPWDNPLSPGHRKVGKNAILFVLVTTVRFQAFAFAVVPQFESVVKRGSQYVFAVGGELDEGDGRVVVVDQSFEALPGRRVPDSTEAVVAARDDEGTVTIEVHRTHLKIRKRLCFRNRR